MKEEDTDWLVYHLIAKESPATVERLISESGLGTGAIEASLLRLERYLLVERNPGVVRVLSFGEALIRCQLKYEDDLPYCIENGVIKARKKDHVGK